MKTTTTIIILLLSICSLPLIISARPPIIRLPTKAETGSPVKDSEGNDVIGGDIYYARVVNIYGGEGGISVANFENPTFCPTDVFLNMSAITYPPQPPAILRPIIFRPSAINPAGPIYESEPINVAFYETDPHDPCPTYWKLDQNMIVAASEPSDFMIMAADDSTTKGSYIFSGIGPVGDHLRLGINTNSPTNFMFVRAGARASNLKSMAGRPGDICNQN